MESIYQYVNGVCGSGKTYTAIKKIASRVAAGETIIYATETKELLEQTKKGLEVLGINVELILADKVSTWKKSQSSIIQKLKPRICVVADHPRVILCTTKSLIRVAHAIPKSTKLPLFIDEGFVVADAGEIISTTASEAKGLAAKLGLADDTPEDYSTNNRFQFTEAQKKLKQYIDNPLVKVPYNLTNSKLQWVAHLDLKAFGSKFSEVTLLSACHEDTIQFQAIKASGCQQEALDWGLATEHVTNGTIYVYWVLDQTEWRTYRVSKVSDVEMENIALEFESKNFTGDIISVKGVGDVGKSLTVKSHGFNNFSDYHEFIDLHTQMPIPVLNDFYKETYNMTDEQIRTACYHYDRYQGAMRTSLRNSNATNLSTYDNYYCFGDKSTAKYFMSKLSSSVTIDASKLNTQLVCDTNNRATNSNKVSNNKAEQKNRSKDRAKLAALNPDLSQLEEALIHLRNWRRTNPTKRMTPKLYEEVAKDFN